MADPIEHDYVLLIDGRDIMQRAMDMQAVDRLERPDLHHNYQPESYVKGILNGVSAVMEKLASTLGVDVTIDPANPITEAFIANEIRRTS